MPAVSYKTCDICRKRKTKCIPPSEDNDSHDAGAPCTNCTRLGIRCTYDHVYKRPGRPSTFAKSYHEEQARRRSNSRTPARAGDSSDGLTYGGGGGISNGEASGMNGDEIGGSSRMVGSDLRRSSEGPGAGPVMGAGGIAISHSRSTFLSDTDPNPNPHSNAGAHRHSLGHPPMAGSATSTTIAPHLLTNFDTGTATQSTRTQQLAPVSGNAAAYHRADHPLDSHHLHHPPQPQHPPTFSYSQPYPHPHTLPKPSTPLPFLDAFDFGEHQDQHQHPPHHIHPHHGPSTSQTGNSHSVTVAPGPTNGLDIFKRFEDEDGAEYDMAMDWPTMSSGNGTGGGMGPATGSTPGRQSATMPGAGPSSASVHGQNQYTTTTSSTSTNVGPTVPSIGVTGVSGNTGPILNPQPSQSQSPSALARTHIRDHERDFQIEDIAPWQTISFFISIYLGYSHSLFPMIHRPSFSQKLALRLDRRNKDFRALVLGIVAYTIGQSPLSRITGTFTRPELSSLQHRCHRGSMMLLDRSFKNPNVMQVATLSAGYFYCQSVGKTNRALTLVSEACQLMHLLRMHDDEGTAGMGLDAVEIQLRRRIWWHVYAVDITEASAGHMIHLNSFEGQPTFPEPVDDEYVTSQGSFPQPLATTSYIVGLVACVRLFPVLEEVLTRSRTFNFRTRSGRHPHFDPLEIARELEWIDTANREVDGIMDGLPDVLKMGWTIDEEMDEVRLAVMGMQRANMAITAVSIRFALADYRAELEPNASSLDTDRAAMGREAYHTLSNIPLDDLAANGESMRGKIFRILLALLKSNSDSPDWVTTLQDWWTLFSRVQFVQLMTSNVESRLPSPEPGAVA